MGARRIRPDEIITMHRLYKQIGTFAGVAARVGHAPATVARYIRMQGVPLNIRLIVEEALAKEKQQEE